MRRVLIFLALAVLLTSLAYATYGNSDDVGQGTENQIQTQNQASNPRIGQQLGEQVQERKQEIKSGNYILGQGQLLHVEEIAQNLIQLMINNQTATTNLNITEEQYQNRTRLRVKLSNGNESEIKIMPDVAAERAIERLRLKKCNETNNCTIQLKEVAVNNNKTAIYEIQVQRHYKLLGLFQAKAQNRIQIDAENGNIVQENNPWWAFLASKQD